MKKQILTLGTLVVGFILGASALSVLAQTGTWTAPTQTAPNGNIDPPVNVGGSFQLRSGKLGVGTLQSYANESLRPMLDVSGSAIINSLGVTGNVVAGGNVSAGSLTITGGSPASGKVLVSDSSGNATWQASSTQRAWMTTEIGSGAGTCIPCPSGWTSYSCSTEMWGSTVSGYARACYKDF